MNGKDLMWESNLYDLRYKPSEKDNTVIIVSSYQKMGSRLKYIRTEFPNAVITGIEDEFGYGLFEVQLQ